MDKAGVEAAFQKAGLSRLIKDIDYVAKATIRIKTAPVTESTLAVGASKVGGLPDLPSDLSWPDWKGLPQSFIAQIRLKDAQPYDTNSLLPRNSMLWFFYDAKQETYGDSPDDRGGWRVYFKNDDLGTLQRHAAPATLPASSVFRAAALNFSSEITLSQHPEMEIPQFDWTDEEQHKYEDLLANMRSPEERKLPEDQLLGFPDAIQDDMRLECQLAAHGVSDPDNDPRVAELSKGAMDWQLLLQIDTDDRIGMRWGDAGMIYYWLTGSDLRAGKFDASWLVLQSE